MTSVNSRRRTTILMYIFIVIFHLIHFNFASCVCVCVSYEQYALYFIENWIKSECFGLFFHLLLLVSRFDLIFFICCAHYLTTFASSVFLSNFPFNCSYSHTRELKIDLAIEIIVERWIMEFQRGWCLCVRIMIYDEYSHH